LSEYFCGQAADTLLIACCVIYPDFSRGLTCTFGTSLNRIVTVEECDARKVQL